MTERGDLREPDLAALYGDVDAVLSPRMAFRLWTAALFLGDTYRDPESCELLMAKLPPVVQGLTDDVWMSRFVSCFYALARRLGEATSSQRSSRDRRVTNNQASVCRPASLKLVDLK